MVPSSLPPEAYLNPYAASAATLPMLWWITRSLVAAARRAIEVRSLKRIPVMPLGWDATGRQCEHR